MSLKEFEDTLKYAEMFASGDNLYVVNNFLSIVNITESLINAIKSVSSNNAFSLSILAKITELENLILTQGPQFLREKGLYFQPGMMSNIGMISNSMINSMPQMGMMQNPNIGMSNANMFQNQMLQNQMMQNQMMQQPQPFNQNYSAQTPIAPQYQPQPQYIQPQHLQPQPQQQPVQYNQSQPQQNVIPASQIMQSAHSVQTTQPAQVSAPASAAVQPAPEFKEKLPPEEQPVFDTGKPKNKSRVDMSLPGMSGGGSDGKAAGRDYLLALLEDK